MNKLRTLFRWDSLLYIIQLFGNDRLLIIIVFEIYTPHKKVIIAWLDKQYIHLRFYISINHGLKEFLLKVRNQPNIQTYVHYTVRLRWYLITVLEELGCMLYFLSFTTYTQKEFYTPDIFSPAETLLHLSSLHIAVNLSLLPVSECSVF